jgi:uncharacterized protein
MSAPAAPEERIGALDLLRGFALLGILVANLRGFFWPAELYPSPYPILTTTADRAAQTAIDLLFADKFITLFSLLFGIGFAVQMDRAAARQARFLPFYLRRLGVLLLIGLAHGWLLWWGDILATYAFGGALLLLFRNCRQRTILIWAFVLLMFPFYMSAWRVIWVLLGHSAVRAGAEATPAAMVATAAQAYLHGSWLELHRQLWHDWWVNNADAWATALHVFPKFLFGLWLWRSGFLGRLRDEIPLLKRICLWCLLGGLAGNAAFLAIARIVRPGATKLPALALALRILLCFAVPVLSAGYAAAIALLSTSTRWPVLQNGMKAIGRAALSNYLLQSAVGTTLAYGYGFALYGKVGALAGLGLSAVIYALQLPLGAWWFTRFRFGPMEWIWRVLSYRLHFSFRLPVEH